MSSTSNLFSCFCYQRPAPESTVQAPPSLEMRNNQKYRIIDISKTAMNSMNLSRTTPTQKTTEYSLSDHYPRTSPSKSSSSHSSFIEESFPSMTPSQEPSSKENLSKGPANNLLDEDLPKITRGISPTLSQFKVVFNELLEEAEKIEIPTKSKSSNPNTSLEIAEAPMRLSDRNSSSYIKEDLLSLEQNSTPQNSRKATPFPSRRNTEEREKTDSPSEFLVEISPNDP